MKGDFQYLFGFLLVFVVQGFYADAYAFKKLIANPVQFDSTPNYRNQQQPQSLIEIFHILMKQATELAIQLIEREQSETQRSFDEVYEQLFKIQENSNAVFDEILNDYWKLSASDEGVTPSSVQAHADEVNSVLTFGRDKIFKCIQEAVGEANNIHESLIPYMESIEESIKNITALIDECTNSCNLIAKEICVLQQVQEVSNSISTVTRDSNESIRLASVQIYGVVGQNTQGCIQLSINDVKESVEKIVEITKDCVANDRQN